MEPGTRGKLGKKLFSLNEDLSRQELAASLDYFCRWTQTKDVKPGEHSKAWAGIAKIIYKCNGDALKTMEPYIQRELTVAKTHELSVQLLHFMRAFLYRIPSLRKSNTNILSAFMPRILTFAATHRELAITRLVCDIAAASLADQRELELLRSLHAAHDDLPLTLTVGSGPSMFKMKVKQRPVYYRLIALAFEIHAIRLRNCRTGMSVVLEEWLDMAVSVMQMEASIHDAVFSWMAAVVVCGRFSIQHLYKRLLSMIEYGHPSVAYYKFIEAFAMHLSIPHLHLKMMLDSVHYPLCKQEYGEVYANAVSSLLIKQSFLPKEEDAKELKARTSAELNDFPQSVPAARILKALLTVDAPYPPVELAQGLFSRVQVIHNSSMHSETRWCWALSRMATRLQTETVFFYPSQGGAGLEEQQRIRLVAPLKRTGTRNDTSAPSVVQDRFYPQTRASKCERHHQDEFDGREVVTAREVSNKTVTTDAESGESIDNGNEAEDERIVRAPSLSSIRKANGRLPAENECIVPPLCSAPAHDVARIYPTKNEFEVQMNKGTNGCGSGQSNDSDSVIIISDEEGAPTKRSKMTNERTVQQKSTHMVSGGSQETVDDILAVFEG